MAAFTYFHALQLALAGVALALIARRLHVLLFQAPLDTAPFMAALETALDAGEFGLARDLARMCEPAWPARLAALALAARAQAPESNAAQLDLEETHAELEQALGTDRDAILALGRIASPLAFIGVILEAGSAFRGGSGLIGLQRGLAVSIALQRSLLAFAIGIGTMLVCLTAVAVLTRWASALRRDLDRVRIAVANRPAA